MLITEGRLSDAEGAVEAALKIRSKYVDVFIVAVGEDPDVGSLVKMVSPPVDNNVFMTTSYNALRSHLRAVTDTICKGGTLLHQCCVISWIDNVHFYLFLC